MAIQTPINSLPKIPKNLFLAGPSNGQGSSSLRRIEVYDLERLFPGLPIALDSNGNAYFQPAGGGSEYGSITAIETGTGLAGGGTSGVITLSLAIPVSISDGGTGTSSPSLIAGTDISVVGSWPNQTVSYTGPITSLDFSQSFMLMGG